MTEATPTWLKIMENGGLGEAHARALLMERFWVLERSVDVEGADFLIQRRLTSSNFLDKDPPRLGVVQVKFVQDGATSINVRKSYLADAHGKPYNEFFLLVFTGREDDQRAFLLQASDVLALFGEVLVKDAPTMRLAGGALLAATHYEVRQKSWALDRIDHALKNADFLANRRFIGSMRYVRIAPEHIDHDLTLPLDNISVDIPHSFFQLKKDVRSVLYEIEEVADAMEKVLSTTDPLEARKIIEDDIRPHIGGGYRGTIQFPTDFLDEDLFAAAENHRLRLAKLASLGLTTAYFSLVDAFERQALSQLMALGDGAMASAEIEISYNPNTLGNASIIVRPSSETEKNWRTLSSRKGEQRVLVGMPSGFDTAASGAVRERLLRERWWAIRHGFQQAFETEYLGAHLAQW